MASPGDGACDALMIPESNPAETAGVTPLDPRIVWNVVASEPTLVTTHFSGL